MGCPRGFLDPIIWRPHPPWLMRSVLIVPELLLILFVSSWFQNFFLIISLSPLSELLHIHLASEPLLIYLYLLQKFQNWLWLISFSTVPEDPRIIPWVRPNFSYYFPGELSWRNSTVKKRESTSSRYPEMILLVSSIGRGGSSWIAELLSHTSSNITYVFEPLILNENSYKERITPDIVNEMLTMVFTCQFSEDLINHHSRWNHNFLLPGDKTELTPVALAERCRNSTTILTKVSIV